MVRAHVKKIVICRSARAVAEESEIFFFRNYFTDFPIFFDRNIGKIGEILREKKKIFLVFEVENVHFS